VVAPGFLANPEVRQWLNGIEPAWTMLEFGSYNALNHEPSADNHAIRLEANLTAADLSGSAVARNALLLLRGAIDTDGLKLTATGNLSRAEVAEMFKIMEWPGLDKEGAFQFHRVINDPDFLPVHFVRVLLQGTKLVRVRRDKLVPTRLGKRMLVPERYGALQALLFQHRPLAREPRVFRPQTPCSPGRRTMWASFSGRCPLRPQIGFTRTS
jgi:hypothetical protein